MSKKIYTEEKAKEIIEQYFGEINYRETKPKYFNYRGIEFVFRAELITKNGYYSSPVSNFVIHLKPKQKFIGDSRWYSQREERKRNFKSSYIPIERLEKQGFYSINKQLEKGLRQFTGKIEEVRKKVKDYKDTLTDIVHTHKKIIKKVLDYKEEMGILDEDNLSIEENCVLDKDFLKDDNNFVHADMDNVGQFDIKHGSGYSDPDLTLYLKKDSFSVDVGEIRIKINNEKDFDTALQSFRTLVELRQKNGN